MTSFKKMIISGQVIEVCEYERKVEKRVQTPPRLRQRGVAPFKKRRGNNIRTLQKHFVRRVLSTVQEYGLPVFVTLTYKHNQTSLDVGYRDLRRFILQMRKIYGFCEVVAVPEFQKRGALHYHLFVWGLPPSLADKRQGGCLISRGEERSSRQLAGLWGQGFVDCVASDGHEKHIRYFSKYMTKALMDDRLIGRKAYYMTKGISFPMVFEDSQVDFFLEKLDTRLISEHSFRSMWLGNIKISKYERSICDRSSTAS